MHGLAVITVIAGRFARRYPCGNGGGMKKRVPETGLDHLQMAFRQHHPGGETQGVLARVKKLVAEDANRRQCLVNGEFRGVKNHAHGK
jgi:hypothetical protein